LLMTRPLIVLILAYVAGITLGRFFTSTFFILPAAAALLWALWQFFSEKKGVRALKAFIPLLLLFLVAGGMRYHYTLAGVKGNVRDFGGEKGTLVGMVEDEPLWREDEVVFPLRSESLTIGGQVHPVNGKVRITLRLKDFQGGSSTDGGEKERNKASDANLSFLSYGQQVSLKGVLYEPRERRNPGGFDYRFFLETQGVAAIFYGQTADITPLGLSPELSSLRRTALLLKEKMCGVLKVFLPEEEGNLLVGMLFGERRALEPVTEQMFKNSGVSHLLAVSGLHVGLIAGFFWFLGKRIGLRGWPAYLVTILLLFSYAYLTGLKPAALRAFIMIALGLGAVYLQRSKDLPTALAAAALFTLCYNPLLLFTASFQLSYAATAALLLLAPPLQEGFSSFLKALPFNVPLLIKDKLPPLLAVSLAAQLGVLPLSAYHFQQVSIIALLTNILILPLIAVLLGLSLAAALLGLLLPLAGSLLNLASYPLLAYMLMVTKGLGNLPFAYGEPFPPSPLEILFFYLALGALAKWRYLFTVAGPLLPRLKAKLRPFHLLVALLILALFFTWWGVPNSSSRQLEVTFLDVGQGDAIYMRTPEGKNILLDGGGKPEYKGAVDGVGYQVVLPFLRQRRVKKLDLVMVSHPHEDHYGGLLAVLREIPVDLLVTNEEMPEEGYYRELLSLAAEKNISRAIVRENDNIFVGPSLAFKVLGPPPGLFRGTKSDCNNNSLVLQLNFKEVSFLFTGDIEEAAVQRLLEGKQELESQILKIPHHGGGLPNLARFLTEVSPRAAVISVGENAYGHPHPELLRTLEEKKIALYRTDLQGAITFQSDGKSWKTETMLESPLSLPLTGAILKRCPSPTVAWPGKQGFR
jgi:competence protein ComEC